MGQTALTNNRPAVLYLIIPTVSLTLVSGSLVVWGPRLMQLKCVVVTQRLAENEMVVPRDDEERAEPNAMLAAFQ